MILSTFLVYPLFYNQDILHLQFDWLQKNICLSLFIVIYTHYFVLPDKHSLTAGLELTKIDFIWDCHFDLSCYDAWID